MKKNLYLIVILVLQFSSLFSQKKLYGDRFNREDYDKLPMLKSDKKRGELLPSIDLKPFCPSVVSQASPTCFAYASAYYGRTILYNITRGELENPNKNTFSNGFITLLAKKHGCVTSRCKGGCSVAIASTYMAEHGVPPYTLLQSDCPPISALNDELKKEAAKYKIESEKLYQECTSDSIKIEQIKIALSDSTPVLFGLYVPSSFSRENSSENPDLWLLTERERSSIPCNRSTHAMCIVGFDDTKYGGAFEIVNSWGDDWKNKGFTYIRYTDLALIARYAIRIKSIVQ